MRHIGKTWLAALALGAAIFFLGGAAMADDLKGTDQKKAVMLGDSLTAGFHWKSNVKGARAYNLGIGGDTVAGVWARLDKVVKLDPDFIFLQIGINNLGRRDKPEEVIEGHLRIWRELRERLPQARLYVVSLLPVRGKIMQNSVIEGINRELAAKAAGQGLTFIDLYPLLLDGDGQLRRDFTGDGLHLKAGAYKIWLQAVDEAIAAADGR